MSSKNSDTAVEPHEEPGDSLSDLINSKSKETHVDPSVQEQGGEIELPNQVESVDEEKRRRTLTQKAVYNAMEVKNTELRKKSKTLKAAADVAYVTLERKTSYTEIKTVLEPLQDAYTKCQDILVEMKSLSAQDKSGETTNQMQQTIDFHQPLLSYASTAINKLKGHATEDTRSVGSTRTRRTGSSRTSTSSSRARVRALAEAAAVKKQAEYDRIMAEKESERKRREAKEEFHREQMRAQHELDMALLEADKRQAVADAKLFVIEQSLLEEQTDELGPYQLQHEDAASRTQSWINAQEPQHPHTAQNTKEEFPTTATERTEDPRLHLPNGGGKVANDMRSEAKTFTPKGFAGNQPIFQPSPPLPEVAVTRCIEGIRQTNQQIVATLARQNLPKCHPDVFDGDATLFHPWKNSFKAMIRDANLNPSQEIAYLRNYTKGQVQALVDNFRKRQHDKPDSTLKELWTELERRFGNTAILTNALLEKLRETAKFNARDKTKLQTFADVCVDVDNQLAHLPGLSCLNYPTAIKPIVDNLPGFLRFKWEKQVVNYAETNDDRYPTFHQFAMMIQKQARLKNHPNVVACEQTSFDDHPSGQRDKHKHPRVFKSDAQGADEGKDNEETAERYCSFHERKGHNLAECKAFGGKSLEEKTDWIKKAGLCFRCLVGKHLAKQCRAKVTCEKCKSNRHPTILHKEKEEKKNGAGDVGEESPGDLQTTCTSVCKGEPGGLSCSKILLVDVFTNDRPEMTHRVYAIIDDQSNASLVSPDLADRLDIDSPREKYLLTTCSGAKETKYGRRVSGISVKSMSGTVAKLPSLIECEHITQDRSEIPTPRTTKHHAHLKEISKEIPPYDPEAKIELLIGRDAPELLKVRAFKNGPRGAPWAQKLTLGWTVSGQMCLDRVGGAIHVSARRTAIEPQPVTLAPLVPEHSKARAITTRESIPEVEASACQNYFKVHGKLQSNPEETKNDIYRTTPEDEEVGMSWEDRRFIKIMEEGIRKNSSGNWEMPLPFRSRNVMMPNNREQAANRLQSLLRSFKRRPQMEKDYFEFLGKVIARGHAELVPDVVAEKDGDVSTSNLWYLPHFGIYHPKKPDQIRVVFDSSCEYEGMSLNKVLLPGPDLMNSLLGVLMRFRQENVGAMCDVEQMFHSFHVDPSHRDFLRFLWYRDNDPTQEIAEYRMTVHLFGNSPSPAVATFGMRRTAHDGEEAYGAEAKRFICKDFYVDDGLTSQPTDEEAVNLVKAAQAALATANLRLHKVASNSTAVMEAFPAEDRAKDFRDLDLRQDTLPAQRTLGVQWNLQEDTLTFRVSPPDKPFTRRGVLSVVNSVYDPLGLAAPVVLVGKLLLQQLVLRGRKKQNDEPLGWDDPLPEDLKRRWLCWREELPGLENISAGRCYHPKDFGLVIRTEIHAFSDASTDGIGTAVYLKQINERDEVCVTLAFGQSRVAPAQPTSIPRLELCAAVLSTQAVKKVKKELDIEIHDVVFYTDSKVVLGYIKNDARRFHVYVANRVQAIRNASEPEQWRYVDTSTNPADLASRGVTVKALLQSDWLSGPAFLKRNPPHTSKADQHIADVDENDPEVRRNVNAYATSSTKTSRLESKRFERFSEWSKLQRAMGSLIERARRFKMKSNSRAPTRNHEMCESQRNDTSAYDATEQAAKVIIRAAQNEAFAAEIEILKKESDRGPESRELLKRRRKLLRNSKISRLDPFVDQDGILRVGGRLHRADLAYEERHPVILPKKHHVTELLIRHHHKRVHHQGRLITLGAIRQAGYWVIGGHRMVSSILHACVTCRRLRGGLLTQHMADLPADRIEPSPPFTNVGMDVFGPWLIRTRKLRGGAAESKRWGLVFTCLSSRAIHIEVLQSMDASSFINALRRFFAIRGPAVLLRCDCGTNFTGANTELKEALGEMQYAKVERYVREEGCRWESNPPHASHFGGAWERQIGTIRRVLDAMLLNIGRSQLDHELLVTLMAEVTGIVNNRPITAIPSDVDQPTPLTPATLLTMKKRPLVAPPGNFTRPDLYARQYQ